MIKILKGALLGGAVAAASVASAAFANDEKPKYGGGIEIGTVYVTLSALSFSLGGIVNLAHGAFYAIGAYLAVLLTPHIGYGGALVASPANPTGTLLTLPEISMSALMIWMPPTEARPMETATEMVSAKHRTMVMSMTVLMSRFPVLHVAGPAGWQRCPSRRKHRLWAWRHNPRTWTATPVRPCFARGRAVRSPNPTR